MDVFSSILLILFGVMFCFVFGMIVYNAARGISRERKNSASPRVVAEATIVAKRTMVRRSGGGMNTVDGISTMNASTAYTAYFATFQFESGDRMELPIPHDAFGLLAEGDQGKLTFQGTRYLDFTRK